EPPGLLELGLRVGLRVGGDQHGAVAERVLGRAGQEGRIDAAGEGHHHVDHSTDDVDQPVVLRVERCVLGHAGRYLLSDSASWASGTMGRAPTWAITSPAATEPSQPQLASPTPRLSP